MVVPWRAGRAADALRSLQRDDFDGLNYFFQIPFALPWLLIPIGGIWSHETDTWIVAGYGLLNAGIIYRWIARGYVFSRSTFLARPEMADATGLVAGSGSD